MTDIALAGSIRHGLARKADDGPLRRRGVSTDVLTGADAYADLLAEWRRLSAVQTGATLFQSPELLSTWKHHFAAGGQCVTVVVRDRTGPILIWPLFVERRLLLAIATGAGGPIGQYDEVLLHPNADGPSAVGAALDALAESVRPDLILLERVPAHGALHAALAGLPTLSCAEAAPYADLSHGTNALLASLKPRVARQQRKRMRRFGELGGVFELARDPAEAEQWLAAAMEMKREWLKSTGRISRAFVKPETARCLAELVRLNSGEETQVRAIVSRVTLEGRTAAVEMGFRHRHTYHLYLRAYAAEFAKLGPGNILTQRIMAWCADNGVGRYDMMAPRTRNKSEWKSGEVPVIDFALPLTTGGRIYAATILKRLCPAMRGAFYALPAPVRSVVAGLALRM